MASNSDRLTALEKRTALTDARVLKLEKAAGTATPVTYSTGALWSWDFTLGLGNFIVQAKDPSRVSIIDTDRGKALRLTTLPGDDNVAGSGEMQRCDVYLAETGSQDPQVFKEGEEQWWSLSIQFPNDFVFPKWHRYALAGFHHTGSTGQGNFTLGFTKGAKDSDPGILGFQGFGGVQDQGQFGSYIDSALKGLWYEFVYHVKWSSTAGFFDAWVNGKRKLSHVGPTLYAGQGVYFKLANYHSPLCDPYPACIGNDPPSSVIYGKIVRGKTALSVTQLQLE